MKKKFYILKTTRTYYDSILYTPKTYKRSATKEEAEQRAAELNKMDSKEKMEKLYRSWVEDKTCAFATEEWYERKKNDSFYCTYEVKESK